MVIAIYRILMVLFAPLIALGYWRRYVLRPEYRKGFLSRLGLGIRLAPTQPGNRRVWIQAVSLGELFAIEPLIRRLASEDRNEVFLTVTTASGYRMACRQFEDLVHGVAYFPMDSWWVSRRVWNQVNPDLAICTESEIWPEHIEQARRRGVPFIVVNARVSDSSYRNYQRMPWLVKSVLERVGRFFVASPLDYERFEALGVKKERLVLTGNLKVDLSVEPQLEEVTCLQLRAELGFGADDFVLLGASTWENEERVLLESFLRLRAFEPKARLLIVPRHIDRRDEIVGLLEELAAAFSWHLRSEGVAKGETDILLGDTYGELRTFAQMADLAFVGKTLPPHKEGQTPVECAALGVPVVMGPGVASFRTICSNLVDVGAARQVATAGEVIEAIVSLGQNVEEREAMGRSGRNWQRSNRGAVDKTLSGLECYLKSVRMQSDCGVDGVCVGKVKGRS